MSITSSEPFLVLDVEVGPPCELGAIGAGARRFIPITGGRVSGRFDGQIIPGGGDWQTIHDDGNLQIEAHYALRAASGALVEVHSRGVRAGSPEVLKRLLVGAVVNPADYYFRTSIRLITGAPELAFLNFRLYVSRGERRPDGVRLEVFEVL
jgi:hypothetical protein